MRWRVLVVKTKKEIRKTVHTWWARQRHDIEKYGVIYKNIEDGSCNVRIVKTIGDHNFTLADLTVSTDHKITETNINCENVQKYKFDEAFYRDALMELFSNTQTYSKRIKDVTVLPNYKPYICGLGFHIKKGGQWHRGVIGVRIFSTQERKRSMKHNRKNRKRILHLTPEDLVDNEKSAINIFVQMIS